MELVVAMLGGAVPSGTETGALSAGTGGSDVGMTAGLLDGGRTGSGVEVVISVVAFKLLGGGGGASGVGMEGTSVTVI